MSVKDSQILRECPFCGGEAEMGINKESTVREYFVGCMNCHIRLYKIGYKRFYTEAEAIAAWNSRADYHGYEQAAIEAWESIKAWNSRAERTCKVISHRTFCGAGGCEEAGELWTLSCGHEVMNDSDCPPNFCDECGAKVRNE